jgi:hypothetical protein
MTKKAFSAFILSAAAIAANAGGSASVVCSTATANDGSTYLVPVVNVTYSTGADAGTPGLFWLGIISSNQTAGAVLTPSGWQTYTGGLYPFAARYDGGLSSTITKTLTLPNGATNTSAYAGYSLYVGDGVYTAAAQAQVTERRTMLNSMKASMVTTGTWSTSYDSDDSYIWSLVQKDMTDNGKYGSVLTIPSVDCARVSGS